MAKAFSGSSYEIGNAGIQSGCLCEQINGIRVNHAAGVRRATGDKVDWACSLAASAPHDGEFSSPVTSPATTDQFWRYDDTGIA
jgi:hypothetical protein